MTVKYSQHYRSEWKLMSEFKEWLQPVQNNSTKAYCKCNIVAKIYCLKQHLSSSKQIRALEPLKGQTKTEFPKIKMQTLITQKAESVLALFICEHASILTIDCLSEALTYDYTGQNAQI